MGTTGAPWNIPFVEPTDIPRTYPEDSEDLALAIAAGLSAAGNPGIGSNVIQTVKLDTFTSTSTSFETVTGLTATITPSSATAKVLIIAHLNIGNDDGTTTGTGTGTHIRLSGGNATNYVGNADGSRVQSAGTFHSGGGGGFLRSADRGANTIVFLDSPTSASPVTYAVEIRRGGASGTAVVGRAGGDANDAARGRNPASLTLIEVAA